MGGLWSPRRWLGRCRPHTYVGVGLGRNPPSVQVSSPTLGRGLVPRALLPRVLSKSERLGEFGACLGVIRRDHWVVGRRPHFSRYCSGVMPGSKGGASWTCISDHPQG